MHVSHFMHFGNQQEAIRKIFDQPSCKYQLKKKKNLHGKTHSTNLSHKLVQCTLNFGIATIHLNSPFENDECTHS